MAEVTPPTPEQHFDALVAYLQWSQDQLAAQLACLEQWEATLGKTALWRADDQRASDTILANVTEVNKHYAQLVEAGYMITAHRAGKVALIDSFQYTGDQPVGYILHVPEVGEQPLWPLAESGLQLTPRQRRQHTRMIPPQRAVTNGSFVIRALPIFPAPTPRRF